LDAIFDQLRLRKIIKIVATRCQILRLECTKFDFGWGSAPDPAGGAYSAPPDPLAGFKGPTSKGGEGRGRGKGKGGQGRGRKGGEGRKGRERRGGKEGEGRENEPPFRNPGSAPESSRLSIRLHASDRVQRKMASVVDRWSVVGSGLCYSGDVFVEHQSLI